MKEEQKNKKRILTEKEKMDVCHWIAVEQTACPIYCPECELSM